MRRNNAEDTLRGFLHNAISIGLKLLLGVIVITMVGVETTSIVAVFGAAGLAVGLALQGSLANFAGGVLILFFKPFEVGHVIEAQGFLGRVQQIQIFNTLMLSLDDERIVMPNGTLSNGPITNLYHEPIRRVDLKLGVSYGDEVPKVRSVIQSVIAETDCILDEPAPEIWLAEHGDSSINFVVRVWTQSENDWPVHFHMMENAKLAFDREGISIPFPQRDVHMIAPAGNARLTTLRRPPTRTGRKTRSARLDPEPGAPSGLASGARSVALRAGEPPSRGRLFRQSSRPPSRPSCIAQ